MKALLARAAPTAELLAATTAALPSKRGPDLVTGSTSYAIALGAKGALVDLAKSFVVYFRRAMLAVPDEFVNAATLDGAGTLLVWRSVVLPMLRPALAATLTLPLQLGEMAGSLLASLLAVLLFLLFQKQFVAGLQAGATKG